MDLIIEARIFDKDQNGINLDLVPEIFIKETREWIEIDKSLSVGDVVVKVFKRQGFHKFTVPAKLFEQLGSQFPPVIRLKHREVMDPELNKTMRFEFETRPGFIVNKQGYKVQFGNILFLGEERGYLVRDRKDSSDFFIGITAPVQNEAFKSLSKSFFTDFDLADENSKLETKLNACHEEHASIESELEERGNEILQLSTELTTIQDAYDTLEASAETIKSLLEEKSLALTAFEQSNKDLTIQIRDTETKLEEMMRENNKLNQDNVVKDRDISDLNSNLKAQNLKIEDFEIELAQKSKDIFELIASIDVRKEEIGVLNAKKKQLQSDLQSERDKTQEQLGELVRLEEDLDRYVADNNTKKNKLDAMEIDLASAKLNERNIQKKLEEQAQDHGDASIIRAQYQNKLDAKTAELTVVTERLTALQEQGLRQVSTESVFSRISEDVGLAARQLSESASPYKLGRVTMNIKAILGADGADLYLPNAGMANSETPLSSIDLELIPDETAPSHTANQNLVAPKLIGLTESAVTKLLRQSGLKLKSSRMVVSEKTKNGRAVKQLPAEGTPLIAGQTIRVTFGKIYSELEI